MMLSSLQVKPGKYYTSVFYQTYLQDISPLLSKTISPTCVPHRSSKLTSKQFCQDILLQAQDLLYSSLLELEIISSGNIQIEIQKQF